MAIIIIYPSLDSLESGSVAHSSEEALFWIQNELDHAQECNVKLMISFSGSPVNPSVQEIKRTLDDGGTVHLERDGQKWFNIEPVDIE